MFLNEIEITYDDENSISQFQTNTMNLSDQISQNFKDVTGYGKYRVFSNQNEYSNSGRVAVYYGGLGDEFMIADWSGEM